MPLHVLSDADVAFIQNLRKDIDNLDRPVQTQPPQLAVDMQVHVAQAAEEIPALTLAADDPAQDFDEPGKGECRISDIFPPESPATEDTVNALEPD